MAENKRKSEIARRRARRVTQLRGALGALAFLAIGTGFWLLGQSEERLLPVRVIEVEGELHHHSSQMLQRRLTERLSGGILTVDLVDLKSVAEDLPWVGKATLRRVWPDTLKVSVEEHRPIARWNADGLVTAEGVVFRPSGASLPPGLPLLEGEDARSSDVTGRYLKWRDDLMAIGQVIDVLSVDRRGDWRLRLRDGLELRLGTGPIEERLLRFIASCQQLEAAGKLEVVDLRYSNGFSVKWASRAESGIRAHSDRSARSGQRG